MVTIDIWQTARRLADASWKPNATGMCPINAIYRASRLSLANPTPTMMNMLYVFQRAAGLANTADIPHWNDTPGRTKAEVLAVFDTIISDLERET